MLAGARSYQGYRPVVTKLHEMFKDNISREPELVYVHRGAAPERVPTSLSGFLSRWEALLKAGRKNLLQKDIFSYLDRNLTNSTNGFYDLCVLHQSLTQMFFNYFYSKNIDIVALFNHEMSYEAYMDSCSTIDSVKRAVEFLIFAANQQIAVEKSDELFPLIATGNYFPAIVGILFIIGLISSAYSAAGSALTALTTSFTVDILGTKGKSEETVVKMRKKVHIGMAVVMGITIFVFNLLNNTSVIDAVYILASYTYGPILGLFAFGIFMKQQVRDKYIPLVAIASPVLCFILQKNSEAWFGGYQFSYELLIFNALFTFIGLCLLIKKDKKNN